MKYKALVRSKDGQRWETRERWWVVMAKGLGRYIRQPVADALWELADRYEVGLWYEYRNCIAPNLCAVICGVEINGVRLDKPYGCDRTEECVKEILEKYKRKAKKLNEPPQIATIPNPATSSRAT